MTTALVLSQDPLLGSALSAVLPERSSLTHAQWATATDLAGIPEMNDCALVILDAGAHALDQCGALIKAGVRPIMVLHENADGAFLAACLETGATGFVTKQATLAELLEAVESLLRGEAAIPGGMLGGLLRTLIDRRRADDAAQERYARLSARERQILGLLAMGQDRQSIAHELFISPQTARTHIQNVLTKLEVHSQVEAAAFAHDNGYTEGGRP